jgi:hypothetical protein
MTHDKCPLPKVRIHQYLTDRVKHTKVDKLLGENMVDTMIVLMAVLLEHCQGAVPHCTKNVVNPLREGREWIKTFV